jgi:1-acyl-sn-glycerol-3-phosphate acyltransferase
MSQRPLQPPESRWQRLYGTARGVVFASLLFVSLLAFNIAQTLSTLIYPLSRRAFRRFNRWAANTWWGWCVTVGERVLGSRVIVSGDQVPRGESAILTANHQQMPDITTIMAFARSKDRLGDLKWFVKKALQKVPGVGWGMSFINCLFVRRDWTRDRDRIASTFRTILDERIPLWLVTFSEGTRFTPEKLQQSRQVAERLGVTPPRHVLLPRPKGFAASVRALRHHVDAVYDLTIGYPDGVPTLWQYICGQVPRIHLHVRRFPIGELPGPEEDAVAWLQSRFEEKDRLLGHFYRHGSFPETSLPSELAA